MRVDFLFSSLSQFESRGHPPTPDTVLVGRLKENKWYYVKRVGDPNIYLVNKSRIELFLKPQPTFLGNWTLENTKVRDRSIHFGERTGGSIESLTLIQFSRECKKLCARKSLQISDLVVCSYLGCCVRFCLWYSMANQSAMFSYSG